MTEFDKWVEVISSVTLEEMLDVYDEKKILNYAYPKEGIAFYTFKDRFEVSYNGKKTLTIYVDMDVQLNLTLDKSLTDFVNIDAYDEFIRIIGL